MATVLRSSVDILLLKIQAQLITALGWEIERVVIDTETGEEEQDDHNFQAEQLVFIRRPSTNPMIDHVGMGRVWCAEKAHIVLTLWTRNALDEPPGFGIGLTDPTLGHEVFANEIKNALYEFQPIDSNNNWLVQQPLEPGPGSGPRRRKRNNGFWARSTLSVYMTFAPDLDQSYQ